MKRILIWDSHPVQYKAPVYVELERVQPGVFLVLYGTDCSIRGRLDEGFGRQVAWDTPLLQNYSYRVLALERGEPLRSFRSLSGRGVFAAIARERPSGILISQFLYAADFAALAAARRLSIPVAIRQETQDEAQRRPAWKGLIRWAVYRTLYSQVARALFIGELNREHLLRHGFSPNQLTRSPYCVVNQLIGVSLEERERRRQARRKELDIPSDHHVIIFSGKLISKKDPNLVIKAAQFLPREVQEKTTVLFMGSGELEPQLRKEASGLLADCKFLGFVNQSALFQNYLAADVLVLPSRRMGETWGLVVNEALHAGCGVVMTNAVGCYREFGTWERVRVIPEGDAEACAHALAQVACFERSFDWCEEGMQRYSVRAAAEGIASAYAL